MHPELDEGALVDQEVQALAGRKLLLGVLGRDLLLAAALPDPLPALLEVSRQGPEKAGGRGVGRHQK